jgi:hypothetical protein
MVGLLNKKLNYAYDHQLSFIFGKKNIKYYLTKKTYCFHANKNSISNFFTQQYRIAKYHTKLSLTMPKQALAGDEISPSSLLLQPLALALTIILLFFSPLWSLIPLILLILLNQQFIFYLFLKGHLFFIIPAIFLIIIKNIAWIFGFAAGLF